MPFNNINLELPHSANMCCVMYEGFEGEAGADTDTREAFNINTVFHSKRFEKIRDQFRKGEKPSVCKTCWSQEDHGEQSPRQGYNAELSELGIDQTYEVPAKPKKVQWTFSNTCNYACRTCSLYQSSGWLPDTRKLAELEQNVVGPGYKYKLDQYTKTQWDEDRYEELLSIMQDAVHLELTGGETLLAKNLIPLLTKLDKRIAIKITTNASQPPTDELVALLKQFKNVCITFSIDAVSPLTFKYIRTGDWFQVERSMQDWLQYKDWINFRSTVTISILNMGLLSDVFKYLDRLFGVTNVGYNWVSDPDYYAVGIMPDTVKEWIDSKTTYFKAQKLLPYMWSGKYDPILWQRFITRTQHLDNIREQPMKNYLTELYNAINKTNVRYV